MRNNLLPSAEDNDEIPRPAISGARDEAFITARLIAARTNASHNHLFQLLGGAEFRGNLRGNLDLLLRARIDALSSGASRNLEYAETGDFYLLALDHRLRDIVKNHVNNFLTLLLGAANVIGNELGKPLLVKFCHEISNFLINSYVDLL